MTNPARPTLVGAIAAQAACQPDAPALIGLAETLTWAAYDGAVDTTARFLVSRGVAAGDRVAVAALKDVRAYVAAHAVLRAGAVVVPIDPLGPAVRGAATLIDAEVRAVIASPIALQRLEPWDIATLDLAACLTLDDDVTDALAAVGVTGWNGQTNDPNAVVPVVSPDDPAYIIFTSGSTGTPKGIVHTHASAMAYAERAAARLQATDRVAGMSPFHFDMSTLELYAAPLAGATVVAMSEAHVRMPASLVQRSDENEVTVWYTVPSLLQHVAARGGIEGAALSSLRTLMFAGETFAPGALAHFQALVPSAEFVNVYGPAEVNECTRHTIERGPAPLHDVPIGAAWEGVDLLVVDEDDRPVVNGERGELWVSAPTVMHGYWRRPDLTAASLVERTGGFPWYRTGDVVTMQDDGVLLFHGRRDHQVKVRGVRLELEAIEDCLADAPGVLQAVAVAANHEGETRIEAVVVPMEGDTIDPVAIRRWCAARLPTAAVPAAILTATTLPLTPSGKIDRARVRTDHRAGAPQETPTP